MADLEEQGRKLLPEFHPTPRHMGPAVECSLCCALVVNSPGARNHHERWHADLWRLMAGVQPFSEEETAKLRTFFEEVDRG
jgi:hypothetical protein